jgi:hypothetical protein
MAIETQDSIVRYFRKITPNLPLPVKLTVDCLKDITDIAVVLQANDMDAIRGKLPDLMIKLYCLADIRDFQLDALTAYEIKVGSSIDASVFAMLEDIYQAHFFASYDGFPLPAFRAALVRIAIHATIIAEELGSPMADLVNARMMVLRRALP